MTGRQKLQTAKRFCDRAMRCLDRVVDLLEQGPLVAAAQRAKRVIPYVEEVRVTIAQHLRSIDRRRSS